MKGAFIQGEPNRNAPRMLNEPQGKRVSVLSVLCGAIVAIVIAAFLLELWMVNNFVSVRIAGNSMRPTLLDGEWVYTQAVEPERGDIVTIDVHGYRDELGRPLFEEEIDVIIKRLIAVEGESVKCENHTVYIRHAGEQEWQALSEPYLVQETADFPAVEIGEGQIFVMGDNRGNSTDSRKVGPLKREDVLGVVTQWSFEHKAFVTKWENFRDGFRKFIGKIFG